MRKWFQKYIGCAVYVGDDIVRGDMAGEYVFCGTCESSDHDDRRDPLQYEFFSEDFGTILLNYKEFRRIMGAMIDKYSR